MNPNNKPFAGRGFLITGAASGIGLSTARLLKSGGAQLALWDNNETALNRIGEELGAFVAAVDISQPAQVQSALTVVVGQLGAISGVIHSAGILRIGNFENTDLETHRRTININLFGTVAVAHAVIPYLKLTRGALMLLCSVSAFYGVPEYASYSASKAGVLGLAQALRNELAGTGIHIGVVCPHSVNSPMLDEANRKSRVIQKFGIPQTPEQIAEAIVRSIKQRQYMVIPGFQARLIFWLTRVLRPSIAEKLMYQLLR